MHLYIVRMHILCKYFFVRIVVDLFAGPFNCLYFSLELLNGKKKKKKKYCEVGRHNRPGHFVPAFFMKFNTNNSFGHREGSSLRPPSAKASENGNNSNEQEASGFCCLL